jgi:hypothetical protein
VAPVVESSPRRKDASPLLEALCAAVSAFQGRDRRSGARRASKRRRRPYRAGKDHVRRTGGVGLGGGGGGWCVPTQRASLSGGEIYNPHIGTTCSTYQWGARRVRAGACNAERNACPIRTVRDVAAGQDRNADSVALVRFTGVLQGRPSAWSSGPTAARRWVQGCKASGEPAGEDCPAVLPVLRLRRAGRARSSSGWSVLGLPCMRAIPHQVTDPIPHQTTDTRRGWPRQQDAVGAVQDVAGQTSR